MMIDYSTAYFHLFFAMYLDPLKRDLPFLSSGPSVGYIHSATDVILCILCGRLSHGHSVAARKPKLPAPYLNRHHSDCVD